MTFRSIIRLFTISKTFPCHITATTNVINHVCTRCALSATYWYVKHAALYRIFISQSFVRGNNSNCPVAGRVSGVVVDERGHAVCLPSVTWNVVVNSGWSLMRGVVNEGFYCKGKLVEHDTSSSLARHISATRYVCMNSISGTEAVRISVVVWPLVHSTHRAAVLVPLAGPSPSPVSP